MFLSFLHSHFQDKLLPPRIERESDESDEDESPKAAPLRFQHRTTSPNSSEENNRHHRNHRNRGDHHSHRNRRNHRNRRDDSNDLEDPNDPNDPSEEGNEDLSGEVVPISGEDDTPFSEQEDRRRQRRLTMGQTLERGLYGFSLFVKRWLRVIGHFASGRWDRVLTHSRELYLRIGLGHRSDLLPLLHHRLLSLHQEVIAANWPSLTSRLLFFLCSCFLLLDYIIRMAQPSLPHFLLLVACNHASFMDSCSNL